MTHSNPKGFWFSSRGSILASSSPCSRNLLMVASSSVKITGFFKLWLVEGSNVGFCSPGAQSEVEQWVPAITTVKSKVVNAFMDNSNIQLISG